MVLYDFDVEEVFTIKTVWNEEVSFNVINIDTISINGINRKRIEFNDEAITFIGKYWIEGIGSSGGLLKPFYPTDIPTCLDCCGIEENLVCLIEDDALLYLKDNYYDCDSLLTKIKENTDHVYVKIWASSNILTIKSSLENYIDLVEVYNENGSLEFKEKTHEARLFQKQLKIEGFYVVRVYTNQGIISKKVFIENNR